jgi:hypothetical protein
MYRISDSSMYDERGSVHNQVTWDQTVIPSHQYLVTDRWTSSKFTQAAMPLTYIREKLNSNLET